MINPEIRRVLNLQGKLVLGAVVIGAIISGARANVATSTLLGGLAAWIPAWVYARIAYSRRHVHPGILIRAHFRGEAVKFILTVVLFGCVLVFYKNLSVAGLLTGYFAAISGYWFGLLTNKR
jgi:ATP synthase protein I